MSDPRADMPDERELAGLREAFAAGAGRPEPDACPPPERIWDAVRGEASAEAVREVLDHVARCPDCSEEWRLAAAFEDKGLEEAETETEAAPDRARSGRTHAGWRVPRWAAAAAVAVLVLGVAAIWWSQPGTDQPAPVYRDDPGAPAAGTIESRLPEDEPLSREEPVLRWTAAGGEGDGDGATYDLLVSTGDLEPVTDATGLTEPEYRISAEALKGLPADTELLWQVEATTPEGRRISSPTFVTRLE